MKYDYLIVGSGLTGAMYAHYLKKHGTCLVVDKNPYVGGLCKTDIYNGIHVHSFGAHIFRTNDIKVWEFVNSIDKFKPFVNTPIAIKDGVSYNLPFNMNTFSRLYGVTTPEEAMRALSEDQVPCDNPKNMEEYVLSVVGKKVYHELIEGYSLKQWGKPCKELPADTMVHIPIRFTYNNNYYDEEYQGVPIHGYGDFVNSLLEGTEIVQDTFSLDKFKDYASTIIYTGPLDELFDYRYGELEFRSVKFIEKIFDVQDMQGVAVRNYTGTDVKYTRTIEHKHFLGEESSDTIVSYEIPCSPKETKMRIYPIRDNVNLSMQRKYEMLIPANMICAGQQADYRSYNMNHIITNVMSWAKRYKL